MLLLIKVFLILKKRNYTRNLIKHDGFNSDKVVLILLIELVVIFYIRPIIIDVRKSDFEFIFK